MRKINVLSLFDGMSCGRLALKKLRIPVDTYYASEIDPYAMAVAKKNFPKTVHIGDVTKVSSYELPYIDLLIGGSPCFVAGTKIITDKGYKNIEDISVGDNVLTHLGRFRRVIRVGNEKKETIFLKAQGIKKTETTNNHPYYIRERFRDNNNDFSFSEPSWKNVSDLEKGVDYIGIPILDIEDNPRNLSEEDCWLIGRYIADGHWRKDKRLDRKNGFIYQVVYSIGNNKVKEFKENVFRHFSCYPHSKSVHRCVISSKSFLELIVDLDIGKGAINKKISMELLCLPKALLSKVINGYISGDGSKRASELRANSISEELIMSLNLAIAKVYNVNSGFEFTFREKTTLIEGRIVNQNHTFSTSFRTEMKRTSRAKVIDNIIWLPFKGKESSNKIKNVYNLEVEDDNSYTANNAIVHNCQGFSFAGKQLNFSDPRSALFFEFVRILEEIREINPDVKFLLENVVMKKEYEDIISEYLGVKPILINSNLLSAQNRKRLYWTNIPLDEVKDKKIFWNDIQMDNATDVMYYSEAAFNWIFKDEKRKKRYIEYTKDSKVKMQMLEASHSKGYSNQRCFGIIDNGKTRYIHPIECERLQTVPDNYTSIGDYDGVLKVISKTQRYRMLGNGWTVDVIAHIFKKLKKDINLQKHID